MAAPAAPVSPSATCCMSWRELPLLGGFGLLLIQLDLAAVEVGAVLLVHKLAARRPLVGGVITLTQSLSPSRQRPRLTRSHSAATDCVTWREHPSHAPSSAQMRRTRGSPHGALVDRVQFRRIKGLGRSSEPYLRYRSSLLQPPAVPTFSTSSGPADPPDMARGQWVTRSNVYCDSIEWMEENAMKCADRPGAYGWPRGPAAGVDVVCPRAGANDKTLILSSIVED